MGKIEYKDVIKSVSYDKSELIYNILKLHNESEDIECDPTYSKGGFYSKSSKWVVNPPKYKYDVYPVIEGVEKIEPFTKWSLKPKSIKSIIIDLPFTISTGKSLEMNNRKKNIIHRRFNSFYPKEDMFKTYYWFLLEAHRVLKHGGICILFTQRTVSGGKLLATPEMCWMFAEKIGFYTIDKFTLIARNRLHSGQIKQQQHSRSWDSVFWVFQKQDGTSKTKQIDYFDFGIFPTKHKR